MADLHPTRSGSPFQGPHRDPSDTSAPIFGQASGSRADFSSDIVLSRRQWGKIVSRIRSLAHYVDEQDMAAQRNPQARPKTQAPKTQAPKTQAQDMQQAAAPDPLVSLVPTRVYIPEPDGSLTEAWLLLPAGKGERTCQAGQAGV